MSTAILVLIVFFIAGCVQGIVGFGFAIATTLVLVNFMDFSLLVFLNLCMSALTSLIALFSGDNLRSINKKVFGILIGSALLGLALGVMLVDHLDAKALKEITLAVILLASILSLTKSKKIFAKPPMLWINGFLSGVLTPSTGINGPLVALHLNAAYTDKRTIRATMLTYLFVIMVFGVVSMYIYATLPEGTWMTMAQVLIPSMLGYVVGMKLFGLLSHSLYQRMVTVFLIASSLMSLIYLII